jgi:NADH:ubiquinone oxidoreductase subunit 2 (subunit N)
MTLPTLNYLAILPLLILVIAAALVLLADLVVRNKRVLTLLGLLAVAAALAAVLLVRPATPDFQGMTLADELGLFASAAILIAAGWRCCWRWTARRTSRGGPGPMSRCCCWRPRA